VRYVAAAQQPVGGSAWELLVWLRSFGLGSVALGLAAGPSNRRRRHFWLRIALLPVGFGVPIVAVALAEHAGLVSTILVRALSPLLFITAIAALMLVPAFLFHRPDPPPGGSDGGGGWGRGPRRPPSPPKPPRGGIPLPDAVQSRVRVRDHARPSLRDARARRPAREPARRPARTPHRV